MFTQLHVHSYFSFESGVSSPEALLDAAAQRGFTALACTDTNGVYGAVEFQQAALARGIRPILGAHLVFGDEEAVVLATDEKAWAALCRAASAIHWADQQVGRGGPGGRGGQNSSSSVPSALSALIATDRNGLIILSANIPFLERVVSLSGPTDIYAELRPGKDRHAVGAAARRLGIRAAVSNAVRFANPEDFQRHRLRVAIHKNGRMEEWRNDHSSIAPPGSWLRPDLPRFFPDCPEALSASEEIAERCEYQLPLGRRVVAPRFAEVDDAFQQLRSRAYQGAERRYGTIAPVTRNRLEHELAIIGQKKFADYFLVVHDIVQNGPTHCGRGSVANSIVSYALGITHVDPLGAGLLFERFLNPERKDPPDIDLDFPWDERDNVLAYVFQKYPNLRSAMVANHNCFRLRGALREVAKVHGRPPGEIREITRRFPWFSDDDSLEEVIANHPNFQGLELPAIWCDLAKLAQPLVGTPRHLSLHPGGVVIVPTTLTDYVPVERAAKQLEGYPGLTVPVIQFEKDG
ncbi:MAG TPA: PHP domain-containing protein, partial [Gemmatimonadales bacterium]